MLAIYKKEMRQYLTSLAGAAFLAAYAALTGYAFAVGNLFAQSGDISSLFNSVLPSLLFLVPVLTMRLMAEERKMRTDQLLLTSPVSIAAIVWGKYAAALSIFALGSVPVVLCAAILAAYGSLQPLITLGNLAGLLLTGSAFVSVGLFASSTTENQIVAAIVSYALLLGLWLIDFLQPYAPHQALVLAVRFLSVRAHFQQLAAGIFSLSTLVYFLGMTLLLALLTITLMQRRKSR